MRAIKKPRKMIVIIQCHVLFMPITCVPLSRTLHFKWVLGNRRGGSGKGQDQEWGAARGMSEKGWGGIEGRELGLVDEA